MRTNVHKRIDEEIVCADCLRHCLTHVHGCSCDVQRVPQGCDPPDFWMSVDGERFAVEVTSIVTNEDYRARCRTLKEAIKTAMMDCAGATGTYALVVRGQPALPRKKEWHDLIQRALRFVSATQDVSSTDQHYLLEDGRSRLGIRKLTDEGATVGVLGMDVARWEGDVEDELRELMLAAVDRKRRRLVGIPECSGVIIILYDAYGYADIKDAQKALLQVEGYHRFHSIFWAPSFTDRPNELSPAEPGRYGDFLYSKDEKWWHAP